MTSLATIMEDLGQTSSLPLYQQLQRALREAIDKRVFGPDEALPAERQLATDLDISRITVRKAIDGLVAKACWCAGLARATSSTPGSKRTSPS
jgi:GntR family transcriptional regulator